MAIFHGGLKPAGAAGGSGSFEDGYSLRLDSATSAYLNHTDGNFQPTSPYTVSFWVKRGKLGANGFVYRINSADNLYFNSNDQISLERRPTSFTTTRRFRDISSWYHIVVKSTPSDVTLYVNGVQEQTASGTANPFSPGRFDIGCANGNTQWFDGYLTDFHWVDGQSLGPESFGESGTYGEWKPIEYTGGHGTNGFYLPFSNPNTAHDITAVGNTQHKTIYSKIGASSLCFDGTGDCLDMGNSTDWDYGNQDFTIECWIYTNSGSGDRVISSNWTSGSPPYSGGYEFLLLDNSGHKLNFYWDYGSDLRSIQGTTTLNTNTWYHVAAVRNGNVFTIYLDGVAEATTTSADTIDVTSQVMKIGGAPYNSRYLDGYLDEVRISNVARYTSNFTPSTTAFTSDANTKLLIHSDTTNGSTVFEDSSGVLGGLGHDASANSNNFTLNNIAVSDQVLDNPENNYPVMNYLNNQPFATTFAEGNLQITTGGAGEEPGNMATMGMSSGKWYFEVYQKGNGSNNALIGIRGTQAGINGAGDNPGRVADGYAFYGLAGYPNIVNNGAYTEYGARVEYTDDDVVSVAVDLDNNKCYWAVNGTYINSGNPAGNSNGLSITAVASTALGEYFPCIGDYDANSYVLIANFGQDGTFAGNVSAGGNADSNGYGNFKYAVPSGFNALCAANLSEPAVKPVEHFDTVLWTGDSSSNRTITTGLDAVDLVWIKGRSHADDHRLGDTVRGGNPIEHLKTNTTEAAVTNGTTVLKSISGGTFNVGSDGSVNGSGRTYVAWNWKADGAAVSNTDGSITTQVSANTDAGFSISTYTGTGSNETVGHGLSKAPELVIIKNRDAVEGWLVGSVQSSASLDFTDGLRLENTSTATDEATYWNDTAPTSSVVSIGLAGQTNGNTNDHVMYCFHSVEGYSKVGSYEGNGSSDGTFVYCGFKPAFLLIKNIDVSGWNWRIMDSERSNDNVVDEFLEPNETRVETTDGTGNVDFLSNGFKFRVTSAGSNGSNSYLYMAFAEQPFKYTNAR